MKRLIIVRHGNTFRAGETPTRVGSKTDLPLVEEQLSRNVGNYLMQHNYLPNQIYAAPLMRTMDTARLILNEMRSTLPIQPLVDFLEVDYGPDENSAERDVELRLGKLYLAQEGKPTDSEALILQRGKRAIELWNQHTIVPQGWRVDVNKIVDTWQQFAANIKEGETAVIVTSNGIIRFAPTLLTPSAHQRFMQHESLKVATGSVAIFERGDLGWDCILWGHRPKR